MSANLLPHAYADFLTGAHQDTHQYALALYDKNPKVGEVYDGKADHTVDLSGYKVTTKDAKATLNFSDVHLDGVTLRYRYVVLFNKDCGNRTITLIDQGKHVGVELGNISIYMPKDGLVEFGAVNG